MEVTTAAAAATPPPPSTKSPEAESDRIHHHHHQSKPIPISNGVLKRHHPSCSSHHQQTQQEVTYKECLKNHAASLGRHALDGCGEFLPSPDSNPTDPKSLKCAVCGCHRNFHRRDPIKQPITHRLIEYHPHHRHHPPPPPHSQSFPPQRPRSPNSQSPPPISSSYYPASAPHMLLALSGGGGGGGSNNNNRMENSGLMMTHPSRKRFRTKFSQEQKEKMYEFAEKVGWKMQKSNEEMVNEFCTDVGVERGVLKVWMHNNKNTFGKRLAVDVNNSSGIATACAGDDDNNRRNGEIYPHQGQHNHSGDNNKSPEHHFRSSNENADVSNSSYSS